MKTTAKHNSNKHYNKSNVMKSAWKLLRANSNLNWSECLKQAWNIEKNGMAVPTIEQIYKKYYNEIFNRIHFKIKNRENAEELASEVFIKCNKHLAIYDVNKAKLSTWLYTIANNLIIDYYRIKRENVTNISQFADAETGKETFQIIADTAADTALDNSELFKRINNAMSSLKPKYKEIAEKYFVEQLSYDEIAECLEIPLGSVKGNINRVRDMLQKQLSKEYANL